MACSFGPFVCVWGSGTPGGGAALPSRHRAPDPRQAAHCLQEAARAPSAPSRGPSVPVGLDWTLPVGPSGVSEKAQAACTSQVCVLLGVCVLMSIRHSGHPEASGLTGPEPPVEGPLRHSRCVGLGVPAKVPWECLRGGAGSPGSPTSGDVAPSVPGPAGHAVGSVLAPTLRRAGSAAPRAKWRSSALRLPLPAAPVWKLLFRAEWSPPVRTLCTSALV